ncbi:hypothetical protein IQ249_20835 [Lusitaniella coriacea LEGE 07157]|uniref:Uncharacterized protein n=1 Tax=Lusitaniella coriacea LEGE 07157 TaxID=945747 RepID=A0A8J7DZP7_9CYAN|nr:hypothetical protein [Lusitaniella coriacea]MBE9118343.1 hypothetical protein [Lusitaniella coriacea LEGE 07157]
MSFSQFVIDLKQEISRSKSLLATICVTPKWQSPMGMTLHARSMMAYCPLTEYATRETNISIEVYFLA